MHRGEITSWDESAGRGLITRDQASAELTLLRSQCGAIPKMRRGLHVRFDIAAAPRTGRPMAVNVQAAE